MKINFYKKFIYFLLIHNVYILYIHNINWCIILTIKKIKTKNGYKIKYPNGTTSYFYPHGTGKRKTKNSAYTGPVKYFHNITGSTNLFTNTILTHLYKSGLNTKNARSAYNTTTKNKLTTKYVKKLFKKLRSLHTKKSPIFDVELKRNNKSYLELRTKKIYNKKLRFSFMLSAIIKTTNGVSKIKQYYKYTTKSGLAGLKRLVTNRNLGIEGS